jgi:hypothetical protein
MLIGIANWKLSDSCVQTELFIAVLQRAALILVCTLALYGCSSFVNSNVIVPTGKLIRARICTGSR